eukprot:Protomagalhaensia_sp_Gyna_25__1052@NODE_1508_length_1774_cov_9_225937_g1223_i0_p1_GENE_NODE_1508_length_1774_cov_9_225937_g1223_i0NODE_1508_length_1774_cov_9_225937_g1223_i0_p1_ORF_typecomplete_len501_score51_66Tri3/PF07428_11/1_3e45Condensation/PF00668_20/9e09Condensation/PF00668_20/30AATase/PF07247_12/4_9e09WES_acyltransf/PF03007_16/0_26_NODE_1508_length_1774_cov_9_225937_g1223_i02721774
MGSLTPDIQTPITLPWQQVAPCRWERECDEAEMAYELAIHIHKATGQVQFALVGLVSLSVQNYGEADKELERALRNAWLKLRDDLPSLSSWIEVDSMGQSGKRIYQTFTCDDDRVNWLDSTLKVVEPGMTGEEFANAGLPTPLLATLFVVRPPQLDPTKVVRDVILRVRHCIIDGVGTLMAFQRFVAEVAKAYQQKDAYPLPTYGSEHIRLSPSLRVAGNCPDVLSPVQQRRLEEWSDRNAVAIRDEELFTIPYNQGPLMPGRSKRIEHEFSLESTSVILRACRNVSVTVTHAFHAALAMTIRDGQTKGEQPRAGKVGFHLVIGDRPSLPPPYNSSEHAATVYHSPSGPKLVIDLVLPGKNGPQEPIAEEFRRVLTQIRDFYKMVREDEDRVPMIGAVWKRYAPPFRGPTAEPPPKKAPYAFVSSLGIINHFVPSQQGPIEVNDVWVISEELTPNIGLFVRTWNQRLYLGLIYNEAWHTQGEATRVLERCEAIVREGLGI